jgi:hypothetical protein
MNTTLITYFNEIDQLEAGARWPFLDNVHQGIKTRRGYLIHKSKIDRPIKKGNIIEPDVVALIEKSTQSGASEE